MARSTHIPFVVVLLSISGCSEQTNSSTMRGTGEDQARQVVAQFIDAYYTWEKQAFERSQSTETERLQDGVYVMTEDGLALEAQLKQEYVAALAPLVADDVNLRCPGWGVPLKHDPTYETVSSVERANKSFIVQATMTRKNGSVTFTDLYEYKIDANTPDFRLQSVIRIFEDGERYEVLSHSERAQQ